ncbi:MAG: hypothetical protein ABI130_01735 [Leifsonia sp.]
MTKLRAGCSRVFSDVGCAGDECHFQHQRRRELGTASLVLRLSASPVMLSST